MLDAADDPDHARLNTFFTVWTWPVVFGGAGRVLIIASIFLLQGAAAWARNEAAGTGEERWPQLSIPVKVGLYPIASDPPPP